MKRKVKKTDGHEVKSIGWLGARDRLLITNALYILESQLFGDDVHFEIMDEITEKGGKPTTDEVRALMDKIKST